MSHGSSHDVPDGWKLLAYSSNGIIAAIVNKSQNRYATQFHPEVDHTQGGDLSISTFI